MMHTFLVGVVIVALLSFGLVRMWVDAASVCRKSGFLVARKLLAEKKPAAEV